MYRIAHLSDLHLTDLGESMALALKTVRIAAAKADYIVITGDLAMPPSYPFCAIFTSSLRIGV